MKQFQNSKLPKLHLERMGVKKKVTTDTPQCMLSQRAQEGEGESVWLWRRGARVLKSRIALAVDHPISFLDAFVLRWRVGTGG